MTTPSNDHDTDHDDTADSIRAQRERQHEAWLRDWRNCTD